MIAYKKKIFTVPNLFVILVLASNFLDVPKSITLSVALLDFESKRRFSGLRSLSFKKISRIHLKLLPMYYFPVVAVNYR